MLLFFSPLNIILILWWYYNKKKTNNVVRSYWLHNLNSKSIQICFVCVSVWVSLCVENNLMMHKFANYRCYFCCCLLQYKILWVLEKILLNIKFIAIWIFCDSFFYGPKIFTVLAKEVQLRQFFLHFFFVHFIWKWRIIFCCTNCKDPHLFKKNNWTAAKIDWIIMLCCLFLFFEFFFFCHVFRFFFCIIFEIIILF